jgi:hypothetical protein
MIVGLVVVGRLSSSVTTYSERAFISTCDVPGVVTVRGWSRARRILGQLAD